MTILQPPRSEGARDTGDEPAEELAVLRRSLARERRARKDAEDIGERATAQLYGVVASLSRAQAVLDETTDIVALADLDGHLFYLNRAGHELLDVPPDGAPAVAWPTLLGPEGRAAWRRDGALTLETEGRWRVDTELRGRDDVPLPVSLVALAHRDAAGRTEYVSAVARDMRERLALEGELAHQALHDGLTGLPNRVLLLDRLSHALTRTSAQTADVAVVFIDLDRFKLVNDSLGHEAGDQLLVRVADLVSATLRDADTVARLGGDEFAVVLEEVTSPEVAVHAAERILEALSGTVQVGGTETVVSASLGIAIVGSDPVTLLRMADLAMYRAKERGRNRWELFEPELNDRALLRIERENELRHAIADEEFVLHYQPFVALDSRQLTGVEALVRWAHPTRGQVPPDAFIPLAEESGLVVALGEWVLREACRQLRAWQLSLGREDLVMSVNVSARQFQQVDLADRVLEILAETGVAPECLLLEITETAVLSDPDQAATTMRRLVDHGVRFALDDFGQGYSSLGHLKRFPLQVVKIDREFVGGLRTSARDSQIVQAVLTMAKALDLTVTAEGIEDHDQLDALQRMGCDGGQGFYLSRPLDAAAATAFIAGQTPS